MKPGLLLFVLIILTVSTSHVFAQKQKDRIALADIYISHANLLLLSADKDSISKAYELHGRALEINKRSSLSYMCRFSVEYMQDSIQRALETAQSFVKEVDWKGEAWVYLGVIQMKLKDSAAAVISFKKASSIFKKFYWKADKQRHQHGKDLYSAKINILQNFMGSSVPLSASRLKDRKGNDITVSISLTGVETVEKFIKQFMGPMGISFFII